MKNLRRSFDRFCFRHRDKGIPNLMLYIALGSALVTVMGMINGGDVLYSALCFNKSLILQGQVWRLLTFVFTEGYSGFLGLIFLYFFYSLGRAVELSIGTLKFNLYYFCGVILMDIFAMIFCPTEAVIIGDAVATPDYFVALYSQMAFYLHLSLLLMFCVHNPDARFFVLFFIPVKAWVMGLIYLVIIVINIFNMTYPYNLFPHSLFPLVGLANFLLFAGSDIGNLFPVSWQVKFGRLFQKKAPKKTGTIPFVPNTPPYQAKNENYNHRCTVCGRTDVSNPELEFRYCSRCNGYHCYCEDHINDHTHIE